MSATIVCRPARSGIRLKNGGTSLWETTQRVFGSTPRLDSADIRVLNALAEADRSNAPYWRELVDLIEKHEEIDLDAEY